MIIKQESLKSLFFGKRVPINNEIIRPFENAENIILKYNTAIETNSLSQKKWESILSKSDNSLKMYLENVKGTSATMSGYTASLQGSFIGFRKVASAISQYNKLSSSGMREQNGFADGVSITNNKLGSYLKGLNGTRAGMSGYISSLVSAKFATIGLQVATTALNMAISMGVITAITSLIGLFDNLINSAKRASEAANEVFEETNSKVSENKEEQKSLDSLIEKYKELKEQGDLDIEGRKEAKEIQNQIADLVGVQASNLDLVNGKLDDEIKKLTTISKETAKNGYETSIANYYNSKKASEKATGDSSIFFKDGYAYVGKREKEAEKLLQDAGFVNYYEKNGEIISTGGRGIGNNIFSTIVFDSYDRNGKELKGAQEKADYLQSMIDVLEQNGQRATDLYAGLIKQRDNYLQYIDNQHGAANDLVNSWITLNKSSNTKLSEIKVTSVNSFEEYRKTMLEEAKKNSDIKTMLDEGIFSETDLINAIDNFMSTEQTFEKYYEDGMNKISIKDKIQEKYHDEVDKLSNEELKIAAGIELDIDIEEAKEEARLKLEELGENGTVNLTLRPQVQASELNAKGWDTQETAETILPNTYYNKDKTVATNFTPIIANPDTGEYIGSLTPSELQQYAEDVISGVKEDDLNLQIGGKFEGKDAIDEATKSAKNLQDLQERFYVGDSVLFSWDKFKKKIEEVKNKATDTASNSISFNEAWASLDNIEDDGSTMKGLKEELINLAEAGELTAKAFKEAEGSEEFLGQIGESAEVATVKVLDMLDAQGKLSAASNGLENLSKAYEEFKDEDIGFVTAETLESLPDVFKGLEGFDLFSTIVGDPTQGTERIQQAFNDIAQEYLVTQGTFAGLINASESEIQAYIANLRQMGITNAEEIVTGIISILSEENDLVNRAEAEFFNAHVRYLRSKNQADLNYLTTAASNNGKLVAALGSAYSSDYQNWCSLLTKKAEQYNEFVRRLSDSEGNLMSGNWAQDQRNKRELGKYNASGKDADKAKDKVKLDVGAMDTNFGGGAQFSPGSVGNKDKGGGGGGGNGSSSKPTKEIFDFIEILISRIEAATERLKSKAEETFTALKTRANAYNKAVAKVTEEINIQSRAYDAYMAKANSIGLEAAYAAQIRDGSINIDEVSDDGLKERIKNYQEWWITPPCPAMGM